ncbi:hypothetical protein EKO27_g9995 [Xylaria grammica]|uniref:Rhodopsin domain-containing protein n=1 Tax=Xylaria grammica TaxID=363999 RepID=A0A439CSQ8_9PEZI|nr:hypothetical protein EKO27_g9995 [Xylaria grammica]
MGASEQLIETWALYSVGSLIIFARIACRWKMIGPRGFRPDDYIIFLSWATYTVMTVAAHIVGGLGDLHALPLETRKNLSGEEAASYIYGTQWFCAGVATYLLFIWTLKLNMLFLYQRIVRGLWVEKFIKPTMFLVVGTFIIICLILFCVCRPYHRMWIIYPDQGLLNMVPPLVLNIVTDILIMAIPTPILFKLQTSLWKKISIIFLFGAVIFIMVAAILRVTMVLVWKSGPVAAIWSCREDLVAILVGQAILIRPMFSKSFWTGNHQISGGYLPKPSKGTEDIGSPVELSPKHKNKDPFSVTAALATVADESNLHINGSSDESIEQASGPPTAGGLEPYSNARPAPFTYGHERRFSRQGGPMVIHVRKNITIEEAEAGNYPQQHTNEEPDSFQAMHYAKAWNGV